MSQVDSQAKLDAIRQRAQAVVNGYPVEADIAVAAMITKGTRLPGGPYAQIRSINQMLFHRVNYTASGVNAGTEYFFFNETQKPGVINFSNGQIPPQTVFALENIGLELVTGIDRDGNVGGTPGPAFSVSAVTGLTVAEQKRKIMALGRFQLFNGNELLFECVGLDKLPIGAGLDVAAAVSTTATTTSMGGAHTTNGAPFAGNRRLFGDSPHLLPGGSTISAKITLPSAVSLNGTDNTTYGFWDLVLYGTTFRK